MCLFYVMCALGMLLTKTTYLLTYTVLLYNVVGGVVLDDDETNIMIVVKASLMYESIPTRPVAKEGGVSGLTPQKSLHKRLWVYIWLFWQTSITNSTKVFVFVFDFTQCCIEQCYGTLTII